MFDKGTTSFQPVEFKFKSESEHTINGQHYDLELQIYFQGKQEVGTQIKDRQKHADATVISIMFDTKKYTKEGADIARGTVISFLNLLKFDEKKQKVEIGNNQATEYIAFG